MKPGSLLIPIVLIALTVIGCSKNSGGKPSLSLESINTTVQVNDSMRSMFKFSSGGALALVQEDDTVVIDTPPLLWVGDALTLSSQVDGMIVITRMTMKSGLLRPPLGLHPDHCRCGTGELGWDFGQSLLTSILSSRVLR